MNLERGETHTGREQERNGKGTNRRLLKNQQQDYFKATDGQEKWYKKEGGKNTKLEIHTHAHT